MGKKESLTRNIFHHAFSLNFDYSGWRPSFKKIYLSKIFDGDFL